MAGTQSRSSEQAEFDEIFSTMEEAIRLNKYNSDDLLQMVGDLIMSSPVLAHAITMHAADFIKEVDEDVTWTDIVVEAYRRALFDIEKSAQYGTGYFVNNIDAMRAFVVAYITDQTMGNNDMPTAETKTHVLQ